MSPPWTQCFINPSDTEKWALPEIVKDTAGATMPYQFDFTNPQGTQTRYFGNFAGQAGLAFAEQETTTCAQEEGSMYFRRFGSTLIYESVVTQWINTCGGPGPASPTFTPSVTFPDSREDLILHSASGYTQCE